MGDGVMADRPLFFDDLIKPLYLSADKNPRELKTRTLNGDHAYEVAKDYQHPGR